MRKLHTSPAEALAAVARCVECGVIESVRAVDVKGEGSGIGAVGGAVAGNEIEKRVKSTRSNEITVRLDDGSRRVIGEANTSTWHAGARSRSSTGSSRPMPERAER